MIIPHSEEDTWIKINICTTWFLALNCPGKQPGNHLAVIMTSSFFFTYLPLQSRKKRVTGFPSLLAADHVLRTWENRKILEEIFLIAWFLLLLSFHIEVWEYDVWGYGTYLPSHKEKAKTSQSGWPCVLGGSALEPPTCRLFTMCAN